MKPLDDFRKRIKQEQERFNWETLRKRKAFEEAREKNQNDGDAACQKTRDSFVEHSECRDESFNQQQDSQQAERQRLASQGASLDKKASAGDLERFKARQRLLKDDSH